MTTDATKKNSQQGALSLAHLLFVSTLVIAALILGLPSIGQYIRLAVLQLQNKSLPLPAPIVTKSDVYIMVQGWDGENNVLALDPNSGEVKRRFEAGYNAAVKLTVDKRILYVYRQSETGAAEWPELLVTGIASAIDTRTGTELWRVNIPGSLFGSPIGGAWLSTDEQHLYLQGNPGVGLNPHIFIVDTRTGRMLHDFELSLPYPSNVDQAFPLTWKLPWDEKLVVASRDQLFTFNLTSGQTSDSIQLFVPGSIQRVPLNLPHTIYVQSGVIDSERRQLFLALSTQEILAIDLDAQPFTIQRVVSLPTGWQFAAANPLLLHPKEKALYVQLKREDTPIVNRLEAEEVWVYDTTTWMQRSTLSLREQLLQIPGNLSDEHIGLDLTSYGLALSPDGQTVYSISRRGLLEIKQDITRRLKGSWLSIGGEDPESFVWKFAIP